MVPWTFDQGGGLLLRTDRSVCAPAPHLHLGSLAALPDPCSLPLSSRSAGALCLLAVVVWYALMALANGHHRGRSLRPAPAPSPPLDTGEGKRTHIRLCQPAPSYRRRARGASPIAMRA